MVIAKARIPLKLPSLNDYVKACRSSPYAGAAMKDRIQRDIGWFLMDLPVITGAVIVHFTWTERTKKRDFDNVSFAKKFILDELVMLGKLEDDSRRYVAGFTDTFRLGKDWSVDIVIEQERKDDDTEETGTGYN